MQRERTSVQRAYERELTASLARLCPGRRRDAIQQLAVPSGLYYGVYPTPGRFNVQSFMQLDSRVGLASNGILQLTGAGYHDLYFDILSSVYWAPPGDAVPPRTGPATPASNGYARLQAALANTQHPSAASAGVQLTPAPSQDAAEWAVAYEFDPPFTRFDQLALAVETSQRTLDVAVGMAALDTPAPVLSSNGVQVPAGKGAAIGAPAPLLEYASSFTIRASFPGVTTFSVAPMPLSEDNRRGWYARDIVHDLTSGTALAGYHLMGNQFTPSQLLGAPVRTWFISRMPTITMTTRVAPVLLSAAAPSEAHRGLAARLGTWGAEELTQLATWAGLADSRFDFSQYSRSSVTPPMPRAASLPADSSTSLDEVTVVFAPPQVTSDVPLPARTAWVLACTVEP